MAGYSPRDGKESDMTEHARTHTARAKGIETDTSPNSETQDALQQDRDQAAITQLFRRHCWSRFLGVCWSLRAFLLSRRPCPTAPGQHIS